MMNDDPDITAAKALMRAHAVAVRRDACGRLGAEAAGRRLAAHAAVLAVPSGAIVSGYWPMGDEIDPRPLMLRLALSGCRLALPVVTARGQALDFLAWCAGDSLVPGPFGTSHPAPGAASVSPDLLLVPLLAFDRAGFRLGYGGGFYDRTLDLLAARSQVTSIGLAYAAQEVAAVPRDRHDRGLDAIATEAGVITLERQ